MPTSFSSLLLLLLTGLAGPLGGCASDDPSTSEDAEVIARPGSLPAIRIGERPKITIGRLAPHEKVEVTACRGHSFEKDKQYTSKATFEADRHGKVHLADAKPLPGGSYAEADAFGLMWSMAEGACPITPAASFLEISFKVAPQRGQAYEMKLPLVDGDPRVTTTDFTVEKDGFLGKLYKPAGNGPFPAIVVWGGSEGALPESDPKFYSMRGYAVLAVQYFDYFADGKTFPNLILDIPLEYFGKAIEKMVAQPFVRGGKVTLMGGSRGAESALLVGTKYGKHLNGIVAWSPPNVVWGDRANGTWSKNMDNPPESASWTFEGKPIPFIPMKKLLQQMSAESTIDSIPAFRYRPAYEQAEREASAQEQAAARIDVASIPVPIMVTTGTEDAMWNSPTWVPRIQDARKAASRDNHDRYVVVRGAGHDHSFPGRPTPPELQFLFPSGINDTLVNGELVMAPEWGIVGGSAARNHQADLEMTETAIDFLAKVSR
jgi:pimeloyl-ACP methyl ester carboxylesterase